uniref:trihelix transcription factor ASR3-like isoform X2 n=1 Tax=Erigeron canadensis TaxID=72917 RepID=UPI001CB97834|nr:trihelix transcription factor ASR3-like isoform X2 [Erigeron canadensis]
MEDDNVVGGGLRTRSKLAPDWTVEESLILVNEVTAVESDCRDTLESFQKWKIIVENCNALGVNRNQNQCRRKWESLLSDYRKIKQSSSKKAATFNNDLFNLIEWYVKEFEDGGTNQDKDSDAGLDLDVDVNMDMDVEPEPVLASIMKSAGSKKRRSKIKTQKQSKEITTKPKRHNKTEEIAVEECSSKPKHHTSNGSMTPEEISRDMQEQILAEKLRENAELIEAIVKQDSMNNESTHDSTRRDGDRLIDCLSNLVVALNQLSKFVQ